jgi:hypothetical protein
MAKFIVTKTSNIQVTIEAEDATKALEEAKKGNGISSSHNETYQVREAAAAAAPSMRALPGRVPAVAAPPAKT